MCNCATLPDCVVSPDHRHGALIGPRERVEASNEIWAELDRCAECGQWWSLEIHPTQGSPANKAFKVPGRDGWTRWDRRPALAEHLIRQHGGLADALCLWKGCSHRALKDMDVCVRHGHSEYSW